MQNHLLVNLVKILDFLKSNNVIDKTKYNKLNKHIRQSGNVTQHSTNIALVSELKEPIETTNEVLITSGSGILTENI